MLISSFNFFQPKNTRHPVESEKLKILLYDYIANLNQLENTIPSAIESYTSLKR